MLAAAPGGTQAQTASPVCDRADLVEARLVFEAIRNAYLAAPASIDQAEFRAAASDYIAAAESCYTPHQDGTGGPLMIDQGGVYFDGPGMVTSFDSGDYSLFGTKWGSGSPTGGQDGAGPQLPGGIITYSFMGNGVDLGLESMGMVNTAINALPGFQSCFVEEVQLALAAWSAVADIQFVPAQDGGGAFNTEPNGNIRIGAHAFDGPGGTLAHAFYPPPNGITAAGDTHFDKDEAWACSGASNSYDFGVVALHEFGHAIGLEHETEDIAVMNPFYSGVNVYGPLADDIIGAGELYGASGTATSAFFGNVGVGTDKPLERLHVRNGELLVEETTPGTSAVINFRTAATGWELKQNGATGRLTLFSPGGGATTAPFKFDRQAQENLLRVGVLAADTVDITGKLVINGTQVTPDYVFAPDFELESIEDHAARMWDARHLPGLASARENETGGVDIVQHQFGVLEELEKAHIYIEQLHRRIRELEQSQQRLAELEARMQRLESTRTD